MNNRVFVIMLNNIIIESTNTFIFVKKSYLDTCYFIQKTNKTYIMNIA